MTTFKIEIDCVLQTESMWFVEMSDGDDPVFTFEPDDPAPDSNTPFEAMSREDQEKFLAAPFFFDPWLMREKFFKIGNDPTDALKFLREYGVWRYSRFEGDSGSNKFPGSWEPGAKKSALPIRFSDLIYQRNYFEDALNCKPADWAKRIWVTTGDRDYDSAVFREVTYLHGPTGYFDISIGSLRGGTFPGPFRGEVTCDEIQDALRATILLDWMEGREWPRCKACRKVFKRTSKHPQFYCCAACASRARQATFRKNRTKRKGGKA